MQVKTILNRIEKHRSFVYGSVRWVEGRRLELEVEIRARANAKARCSGCGCKRPGYDTLGPRRFEHVPLWGVAVFFGYVMRRVSCGQCGVKVEAVPWASGKRTVTESYAWFLARWARRLSWKEVAEVFHTSWEQVFRAVERAVEWGRAHQDLSGVSAIGIDELSRQRGQRYLTLVYQIDEGRGRLLRVGRERREKTLEAFFDWFGERRSAGLAFIASDMWKPYLEVIARKAGQALHVLDRFHIMAHMSKAIDEVRAKEARELAAKPNLRPHGPDSRKAKVNHMLHETKVRLLASMNAGRLVVVCGAGLSMAPPSNLPSAQKVAELCFDAHRLTADPNFNPALRSNLEAIAEHFAALRTLETVFLAQLAPWCLFSGSPNIGHATIADFLITRALVAGLSSNYDILVERCAWAYGADFCSSLDGDEANLTSSAQGPFLKLHGCAHRDRLSTIWAPSQLQEPAIASRIKNSKAWISANLRQKDLLIAGFWSDWQYLNQVIGAAIQNTNPLSVTVVDPSSLEQLKRKAPDLWKIVHTENISLCHVQTSAHDFLDDLRLAFSRNYMRQVFAAGRKAFELDSGILCEPAWLDMAKFDSESLYSWRRDAEGVPAGLPATRKRPKNNEILGFFHLLLRQAGARQRNDGYELDGRTIRIVNGAGAVLSSLRERFIEAPVTSTADMVVAVGATNLGLPGNIVRRAREGDFIRPEAGGEWFDMSGAREELDI